MNTLVPFGGLTIKLATVTLVARTPLVHWLRDKRISVNAAYDLLGVGTLAVGITPFELKVRGTYNLNEDSKVWLQNNFIVNNVDLSTNSKNFNPWTVKAGYSFKY